MTPVGHVQKGAYKGQWYAFIRNSPFPRWAEVRLTDANGRQAIREVRTAMLEVE